MLLALAHAGVTSRTSLGWCDPHFWCDRDDQ